MNVLIDRDDAEAVAITNETDLFKAVRSYLRSKEEMSSEYFSDGQESLTVEQFLERPDLIRDAFKLEELPVITTDARLTMEQRGKLAFEVFDKTFDAWDSFTACGVGKDLAYLMGAILDNTDDEDSFVDCSIPVIGARPELYRMYRILRQALPDNHPVWKFIIKDKP